MEKQWMARVGFTLLGIAATAGAGTKLWDFDDVPVNSTPTGWTAEAMGKASPLATFSVIVDMSAP